MTLKLPDHFSEEVKELGECHAIFKTGIAFYVYSACFLFLLSGIFFVYAIAPLFVGAQGMKGNLPDEKMAITSISLLTAGALILKKSWERPRIIVFAFEHGLTCVESGKIEIVLWADVNRVLRVDESNKATSTRAPGDGIYRVTLICRDGRQFAFNEMLSHFRDFSRMVKEHTLQHMLPPAQDAYNAGESIGFGPVSIDSAGIHYRQDTLSWDLFERAEVSKGRLLLYSRNGKKLFGRLELSQVPNVHVLLALTDHASARRQRQ